MQNNTPAMIGARHLLTTGGWRRNVTLHLDFSDRQITEIEEGIAPYIPQVYDCVLPGMPNVHSHAFQRAMAGLTERRSAASNDSFWTWREWMYTFLDRITPNQNLAIARWLYIEMLKAGYTRVGEFHYLHRQADGTAYDNRATMAETILQAASETGIGLTLLPVLYASSDFGGAAPLPGQRRFLHSLDEFEALLQQLRLVCRQNVPLGIAPHSLRAVPDDMLRQLLADLPGLGMQDAPKHIHVAEQVKEVEASLAYSGKRPAEWLFENLPVDSSWCFIHSTHLNPAEISALAGSGAVAGLCPTTEGNLGDGFFPASEFLNDGGRFAIGTDSHILLNPAEELRLLEYTQRLQHKSRALLLRDGESVGRTLWQQAVANGNQALGVKAQGLAPGAPADFIALDLTHPLFDGKSGDALLDTLVFAQAQLPVKDVFIGAKRVIENGHHPLETLAAAAFRTALRELTA